MKVSRERILNDVYYYKGKENQAFLQGAKETSNHFNDILFGILIVVARGDDNELYRELKNIIFD